MRMFPVIFVELAVSIAFLQMHGYAQDDSMKNRIVRVTLNQNAPAVIRVATNGVTSLEFPYKIEAIDGYGFSPMPSAGDGFQIWYTKGTNFFSVRALKPGVTGNLTVVLDQKLYSLFFQESSEPSFVAIFEPAGAGLLESRNDSKRVQVANPAETDFDLLVREVTASKTNGTIFNEPPDGFLPTNLTIGQAARREPLLSKEHRSPKEETSKAALSQAGSKKAVKKPDPKPQNKGKDDVAKNQKPPPRKLFGWL